MNGGDGAHARGRRGQRKHVAWWDETQPRHLAKLIGERAAPCSSGAAGGRRSIIADLG